MYIQRTKPRVSYPSLLSSFLSSYIFLSSPQLIITLNLKLNQQPTNLGQENNKEPQRHL